MIAWHEEQIALREFGLKGLTHGGQEIVGLTELVGDGLAPFFADLPEGGVARKEYQIGRRPCSACIRRRSVRKVSVTRLASHPVRGLQACRSDK